MGLISFELYMVHGYFLCKFRPFVVEEILFICVILTLSFLFYYVYGFMINRLKAFMS